MSGNEIGMPHGRRTDNNAIEWKPMNDIQAARDTLARWAEGTTPGPWQLDGPDYHFYGNDDSEFVNSYVISAGEQRSGVAAMPKPFTPDEHIYLDAARQFQTDAALIVAMTDPRLRDALDRMLSDSLRSEAGRTLVNNAERIAAAILDIDKGLTA